MTLADDAACPVCAHAAWLHSRGHCVGDDPDESWTVSDRRCKCSRSETEIRQETLDFT